MKKSSLGVFLSAANIAYDQLLPALRRSNRAEVVAIASRSEGRAERFNIPTIYKDYNQLLDDPTIDAVYIPLPNALHTEWSIEAAKKRESIFYLKKTCYVKYGRSKKIFKPLCWITVWFFYGSLYVSIPQTTSACERIIGI
ncbi:hypothetical protein GCM10020331_097210 [Ectobacillus funiculus]